MQLLWEGLVESFRLLIQRDPLVVGAAWRSLWISTVAVSVAAVLGIAIGSLLARKRFVGRMFIILAFRTGMGIPTVLIGLSGYAILSRRGPLGAMELLYTPWGIVLGEICLALPIVITLTHGAIRALDPRVSETARSLGAGPFRRWATYLSEARLSVLLSLLTAFARCFTELGIAMMLGGNIKYRTRTLAAATALETARGEFARGIAMSLVLLLMALAITIGIGLLSRAEDDQ